MDQCAQCGYGPVAMAEGNAKRRHAEHHARWASGIQLPPGISPPDEGVLVVRGNGPTPIRRFAWEMAGVAKLALGHDVPSFEFPRTRKSEDWDRYQTTAYLAVRDGAAIGYVVVRWRFRWGVMDIDNRETEIQLQDHAERRPCVDLAFVCDGYQERRIASALVRDIADDCGFSEVELAHTVPFTHLDWFLARRFSVGGRLLVTK